MQTQTLIRIKQQIVSLDENEKQNLADFLAKELKTGNKYQDFSIVTDDEMRKWQLKWLKENREKYAGKYVALVGDNLVGEGKTIREAHEKAKENGLQNPFLTKVYSETDVPFGGWFWKIPICLIFLSLTSCGNFAKSECINSIEGKLAETTYTYDYVKNVEDWYFLTDEEEKELFNKAKIENCSEGDASMEKKYQVGLRKTGEHSFEVKVQLKSNKKNN